MKKYKYSAIEVFALIEMCIGGFTFFSGLVSCLLKTSVRPLNVLTFVLITSLISFFIGMGLLFRNRLARQCLLYFAFSIILSKILIFADIIHLNGGFETAIPEPIKNIISITYHLLALSFFSLKKVETEFID